MIETKDELKSGTSVRILKILCSHYAGNFYFRKYSKETSRDVSARSDVTKQKLVIPLTHGLLLSVDLEFSIWSNDAR